MSKPITQEKIDLVKEFLRQYEQVDKRGLTPDPVGWIMLKFSCNKWAARRLIHAAEQNLPTNKLGGRVA